MVDNDEYGGDPPCWAHLFEDEICTGDTPASPFDSITVNLAALAGAGTAQGVAWSHRSADLDANLLVFSKGDGVAAHVNDQVDVLILVISGEGIVQIDDVHRPLRAGQAVLIAKGARRSLRAVSDSFAYLSCHRHREGLFPIPSIKGA